MSLTLSAAIRKNRPRRNAVAISIGAGTVLSIARNGRLWAWGENSFGQAGINNATNNIFTPVSVLGAVKTFCKIMLGSNEFSRFVSALDKNGRAWGWGYGGQGNLGNNSFSNASTPVAVAGVLKTFCQISSGRFHTIAINQNGRAWGWGGNGYGQVGDNSITARNTPVSILGAIKTFCKVASGNNFSLAIDKNGRLWGWGDNSKGQIGDNSTISRRTPVSILGTVKTFCQIAAGGNRHSLAIDKNGRLWGWGYNFRGEVGDNSASQRNTPVSVLGAVKTFCKIAAGQQCCLAIDKNGRLWAWGENNSGTLGIGDNTATSRRTPVSVLGAVKTFCEISMGRRNGVAIDKNGRTWAWGSKSLGTIGDNQINSAVTPVSVAGSIKTFCTIEAGVDHSFAIDKNGRAWGWGYNRTGRIGNNSLVFEMTPVSVAGAVKTFCKISGGGYHSLAIDKNGRAWGWGGNYNGQIGNNTVASRLTPVSVLGAVKTFCAIDAGSSHSAALDKNGRAWCWGWNGQAALGDGTLTNRCTPVSVIGAIKTFCKISAGDRHCMAIDKNGRAWGWGYTSFGRLGNGIGAPTCIVSPVSVAGAIKTFCEISTAIGGHTIAIDKNGRLWGWGYNSKGQIGDNSVLSRITPVSVCGAVKTFCKISATFPFSLAIDKNGRVWGWGYNSQGRLGVGTTVASYRTPVSIAGAVKTFCHITCGSQHSLAIDKNGRVWGWGYFGNGRVGNGQATFVSTPVQVCNI